MRLWNVAAVPEVRGKPVLISVPGIPLEKEEDVVGFSWKRNTFTNKRTGWKKSTLHWLTCTHKTKQIRTHDVDDESNGADRVMGLKWWKD